jgi:ubiquinone/menaquinone biosynthesis C-methylase UbiE
MTSTPIRFDDGAAYERYMGVWSQHAGRVFLDWLGVAGGLRWLDVGCGNGAFTELAAARCAPASIHGVDPSEAQLNHARSRPMAVPAQFSQGDAMALPFPDDRFDLAVMPLVIFFVPEPARGVAEMARVVVPGGVVGAYAWDLPGGGFPYEALHAEIRNMGFDVPTAPNPDAARADELTRLWTQAGLRDVETTEITVQRTFADFEDYWSTVQRGPSVVSVLSALSVGDTDRLKAALRARLGAQDGTPFTCSARANAVKGRVPA